MAYNVCRLCGSDHIQRIQLKSLLFIKTEYFHFFLPKNSDAVRAITVPFQSVLQGHLVKYARDLVRFPQNIILYHFTSTVKVIVQILRPLLENKAKIIQKV